MVPCWLSCRNVSSRSTPATYSCRSSYPASGLLSANPPQPCRGRVRVVAVLRHRLAMAALEDIDDVGAWVALTQSLGGGSNRGQHRQREGNRLPSRCDSHGPPSMCALSPSLHFPLSPDHNHLH